MSGIGFWELIILFLVGLIVLGPERLPSVANQLGSWMGKARRMTRVMKRQLEEELNFEKNTNQNIKTPLTNDRSIEQPQYVQENNDLKNKSISEKQNKKERVESASDQSTDHRSTKNS
jgi:sec-independent protein translocase protein TatB